MGGGGLVFSLVLFFWGLPVAIVVGMFGALELLSTKYGTYPTSLVSFGPLAIELSMDPSRSTFVTFGGLGLVSAVLWIVSGVVIRPDDPPQKNEKKISN